MKQARTIAATVLLASLVAVPANAREGAEVAVTLGPPDVSVAGLTWRAPGDCVAVDPTGTFVTGFGGCQDTTTGIVWGPQTSLVGAGVFTWEAAQLYCAQLDEGGYTDWGLPSKEQLLEVVANGGASYLNVEPNFWNWSTTTKGRWRAWWVNLVDGSASAELIGSLGTCTCVRNTGGTPPPDPDVTVTSIDPDTIETSTTLVDVEINGTGFQTGADVTFENGSGPYPGPAPTAANVRWIDATTLLADVTAPSNSTTKKRRWDVRVTNPDASTGILPSGLTVLRQ